MKTPVAKLEGRIAYQFQNKTLAQLALTHSSAHRNNNQRLEFLGDSILGFLVAESLYAAFPDASEGDLTRMRSALINKDTLADIARTLEMGELLSLGPGELKSGGRQRVSILADAIEALIGAVYLDAGIPACRQILRGLLAPYMPDMSVPEVHKDAKTRLQEYLQALGKDVPVYKVTDINGEAHNQIFVVSCKVKLRGQATQDLTTQGQGKNRRLAEQEAAQSALALLEQHKSE